LFYDGKRGYESKKKKACEKIVAAIFTRYQEALFKGKLVFNHTIIGGPIGIVGGSDFPDTNSAN